VAGGGINLWGGISFGKGGGNAGVGIERGGGVLKADKRKMAAERHYAAQIRQAQIVPTDWEWRRG